MTDYGHEQFENFRREADLRQRARENRTNLTITLVSTFVAIMAAGAAFWSGYEAHKTRLDDERPFVAVDTSPDTDNVKMPLRDRNHFLPMRVSSFGKTPARNVRLVCVLTEDNDATPILWPPKNLPKDPALTVPYILPTRGVNTNCPVIFNSVPDQTTNTAGMIRLGYVEYDDERGTHYVTPFCTLIYSQPQTPTAGSPCPDNHGLPPLK
jgi:hypothetical protein